MLRFQCLDQIVDFFVSYKSIRCCYEILLVWWAWALNRQFSASREVNDDDDDAFLYSIPLFKYGFYMYDDWMRLCKRDSCLIYHRQHSEKCIFDDNAIATYSLLLLLLELLLLFAQFLFAHFSCICWFFPILAPWFFPIHNVPIYWLFTIFDDIYEINYELSWDKLRFDCYISAGLWRVIPILWVFLAKY